MSGSVAGRAATGAGSSPTRRSRRRRSGAWSCKVSARTVTGSFRDGLVVRTFPGGRAANPRHRLRTASSSSRRRRASARRARRPVRARPQRPLERLPGVRGRPRPDRHHGPTNVEAYPECCLPRLHPRLPHRQQRGSHAASAPASRSPSGRSAAGRLAGWQRDLRETPLYQARSERNIAVWAGSGVRARLTQAADVRSSPDGSTVGFRGARLDPSRERRAAASALRPPTGRGVGQVTDGRSEVTGPRRSPDGRTLTSLWDRATAAKPRLAQCARDRRAGRGPPAGRDAGHGGAPRVVA